MRPIRAAFLSQKSNLSSLFPLPTYQLPPVFTQELVFESLYLACTSPHPLPPCRICFRFPNFPAACTHPHPDIHSHLRESLNHCIHLAFHLFSLSPTHSPPILHPSPTQSPPHSTSHSSPHPTPAEGELLALTLVVTSTQLVSSYLATQPNPFDPIPTERELAFLSGR